MTVFVTALSKAKQAYARAPHDAFAALGLLRVLEREDQSAIEQSLLEHIFETHPAHAEICSWLGLVADRCGAFTLSCAAYQSALAADPKAHVARHNLATQWRQAGKDDHAFAVLAASDRAHWPPETWMLFGHLHADHGTFPEAVDAYRQAVAMEPGLLPAHESLSRLLPQLGRAEEALTSYHEALKHRPSDQALWASAIGAAKELRLAAPLEHLAAAACDQFGASPDLLVALSLSYAYQGKVDLAIAQLERVAAAVPRHLATYLHLAPLYLSEGDWKRAEGCAHMATQLDSFDQSGWAWLSIIWRLTNDPREEWLADYERLVIPIDLFEEANLSERGAALDSLSATLHGFHKASHHPLEQSPRGGTQTRGDLFSRQDPVIDRFKNRLQARILQKLGSLPEDPNHPFLSRNSRKDFEFSGAWSVRLKQGGHHSNHIHHKGWMSSAFYVSLPETVRHSECNDGALIFGVPEIALPFALEPRRIVRPKEGHLVLFPSYFWHGTKPFSDDAYRLTMAFDLVPRSV